MPSIHRVRPGFAIAGLVLVALVAYLVFGAQKPHTAPPAPSTPVYIATVQHSDMPETLTAIGQAVSLQGVSVQAQINGVLTRVLVKEGSSVHRGDLLAEIACDPYQAALKQAEGALGRDQALLDTARLDLKRYQTLAAQDSIARQQAETQANLVKQDEGVVKIDQGVVDAAKVNVGYCRITSAGDGRVSLRNVDPGNVVAAGSAPTTLFTVNQIAPIAATFTVPQGDFSRLVKASDGFAKALPVSALSQETGETLAKGSLFFVDNHVDPNTGTVALKAVFPNADRRLLPGQFLNVSMTLSIRKDALSVPVNAVSQGAKGPYAYVVGADGKAQVRSLVTAGVEGPVVIIASGLKAGESVVLDGQMSLKPGARVKVISATPGKVAR